MESATSLDEGRRPSRLLAIARRWPGLTAVALMALVGLGISIYLTVVHYDAHISLACTNGGIVNCTDVTSSAWSVIPGTSIPITIPGMLWFLVSGGLALWSLAGLARGEREDPRPRLALLVWAGFGLAFVLYLVFAEIYLVRKICEWCTGVHLLTLATFLIALTRFQRRNEELDDEEEAPAPALPRRPPSQALSRRTRTALRQRAARGR